MSRILRKSYLQGDLAAAEALLSSMPPDDTHVLDRIGIQSRIREARAELGHLLERRTGNTGEAILLFYGAPVVEEHGIDARFSAEALKAYQDLVSKQVAALLGPVGRSGPIRAEKESHLHITNVVHGSFGFELEEVAATESLFEPTPLAQAIEGVTTLIQAVRESDEAFADVVAETDSRVYDALREFLSIIHKAGAAFRVVSEIGEVAFDADSLATATERASSQRTEIEDQPLQGTFLGVLLDSRRFEHKVLETGEVLRGKVADNVDARDLLRWVDKPCIAHMQVVTLARGSRELRRYTLLRLTAVQS
jgi:hypothetical protein